ncbi:MAG: threonine synthase [Bacteroidia bacterium]|nr:threonine synthase [Bacteroidia bacterium]NNF31590.1 threonine synthase [Flavobacteriaceae bacterium]MBT8275248.1 threonine synthase [Bacteroidia bacterium]NNJ82729.1 threonine synthase [Flavobacteriaceae bacterium]NNK53280.1 threonine synthase [Flavobacteriaceae bacterium]
MQYFSLHKKAAVVSFREAVIRGLAPDRGLYYPTEIKPLAESFIQSIEAFSDHEIAFEVIKQFVGDDIPLPDLHRIVKEVLTFDFPLVEIEPGIFSLELFHGPTLAFKDVGARFMARCLGYFNRDESKAEKVTVLVATSGDTGGAVANGFYEVDGVEVVILYPSGKVSDIQEKQLTTLGKNIRALEVSGNFDDCQAMVKKAFLDEDFEGKVKLTSANSINVARWLPQMFYYFIAYKKLKKEGKPIVFSVPSGNFGNICAGMMAQKIGLPVAHFITGTNANNIVPQYLKTGDYTSRETIATIANAMDVAAPSNFIRIEELHNHNIENLRNNLSGYSYSDKETRAAMNSLFSEFDYIADPHGAIGYSALKDYIKETGFDGLGVFLETAHPVKFLDVIPKEITEKIILPQAIANIVHKEKIAGKISTYSQLKSSLLSG